MSTHRCNMKDFTQLFQAEQDGSFLSVDEMCIQPLIRQSPHGKRVDRHFKQSKYKMQRLNFFVVQQSLEWNTVMQIRRGAAIMGERYGLDMAWRCTSLTLSQSFDSQSSSPTFLSLCSFTVFREIRGEKQLGRTEAFFLFVTLGLFPAF